MRAWSAVVAAGVALAPVARAAVQDPAADLAGGLEAYGEGRLEAAETKFKAAHDALGGAPGDQPDVYAQVCYFLALTQAKIAIKGEDHKTWDQDRLWGAEELLNTAVEQPKYAGSADAWADLGWLRQQMRPISASYFDQLSENSVIACDRALAIDAKHPRAGLIKGQCLADGRYKNRDLELATKVLEQDLQNFPGRLDTVLALCGVYGDTGDASGVERTARAGLSQAPNSPKLRMWLGRAFAMAGNLGAAADQFKQAATAEPDNYEAVNEWANAAAGARTPPDVLLQSLADHAKAHPKSSVPDDVRARVQSAIGRDDDALATLADLLSRFPKSKKVTEWAVMRVAILERKGDAAVDGFVDAVCAVWKIDPKNDEAWNRFWPERGDPLLAKLKRTGDWARGVAVAEKVAAAITAHEDNENWAERKAMCHWVAWECHMNLGAHDASEKAIRKAIELDARNPYYRNSLGLLLRYLGRTDEAVAAFRAALERKISLPWAWENLGATYLAMGQVREAREALTQGLAWAREDEQQYEAGQPELQAAMFETWKLRRLLIDAWRLEAAGK